MLGVLIPFLLPVIPAHHHDGLQPTQRTVVRSPSPQSGSEGANLHLTHSIASRIAYIINSPLRSWHTGGLESGISPIVSRDEHKAIVDRIKIMAYNAEEWLPGRLRQHYSNPNDILDLLQTLAALPATS
jgi:hypothetical protein